MRTGEFISRVATRVHLPHETVAIVMAAVRDELVEVIGGGGDVVLSGLGRFRMARQVRAAGCSLTGVKAGSSTVYVTFRACRLLKRQLADAKTKAEATVERLRPMLDRALHRLLAIDAAR